MTLAEALTQAFVDIRPLYRGKLVLIYPPALASAFPASLQVCDEALPCFVDPWPECESHPEPYSLYLLPRREFNRLKRKYKDGYYEAA